SRNRPRQSRLVIGYTVSGGSPPFVAVLTDCFIVGERNRPAACKYLTRRRDDGTDNGDDLTTRNRQHALPGEHQTQSRRNCCTRPRPPTAGPAPPEPAQYRREVLKECR